MTTPLMHRVTYWIGAGGLGKTACGEYVSGQRAAASHEKVTCQRCQKR